MENHIEKIFTLAYIRKIIDSQFIENDPNYFDVMEKIVLPSEDGEFSKYDAIFLVTKAQQKWVESLFGELPKSFVFINL